MIPKYNVGFCNACRFELNGWCNLNSEDPTIVADEDTCLDYRISFTKLHNYLTSRGDVSAMLLRPTHSLRRLDDDTLSIEELRVYENECFYHEGNNILLRKGDNQRVGNGELQNSYAKLHELLTHVKQENELLKKEIETLRSGGKIASSNRNERRIRLKR